MNATVKTFKQKQDQQVQLIKPILERWNKIQEEKDWVVEKNVGIGVTIYDNNHQKDITGCLSMHGSMLHEIGQLADVMQWTWAVYADELDGVYINLS